MRKIILLKESIFLLYKLRIIMNIFNFTANEQFKYASRLVKYYLAKLKYEMMWKSVKQGQGQI